jgi:CRP-like cAMP-binding protein
MELVPAYDGTGEGEEEARGALGHVPILANVLDGAQLNALAKSCEARVLPAGTVFIRQGETGSSMFVILEGAARVSIAMPDGEVREVAVLAVGDIVGEMSLMTGAPRTASVKSLTAMRVLEVTKTAIEPLLAAQPGLLERFSDVLAARQSGLSEIASTPGQTQALQNDILAQMRRFFSRAFR